MAFRAYLMPTISGTTAPVVGVPIPNRIYELSPRPIYASRNYGLEPVCLVFADVTPAQHTALIGNLDVSALPVNLDTTLTTGAVTQIQAAFIANNIPDQWVDITFTYRQVLQRLCRIFELSINMKKNGQGRLFPSGVTLLTQFNQLTAGQRTALRDMADRYGFDKSGLTGASTMRQMIHALVVQWAHGTILFGPETF